MAAALGLKSARELREATMLRLRQYFRQGGMGEGRDSGSAREPTHALDVASWASPATSVLLPWAAAALRSYLALRRAALDWAESAGSSLTALLRFLTGSMWLGMSEEPKVSELSLRDVPSANGPRVDLDRVLRELVRVHGSQLLLDGVYNADPHPGNVM